MSQTHSPFKFLDSYQQTDIEVFFGREKETLNLYNALSGVKHLMVYGPSGSGKTSLVECGLRNQFSDADWFAITIRRGNDINASVFACINKALIEKIETDQVTKMPVDRQIEFGQAIEQIFAERYQPVYLLFDQFEELLISGDAEEKKKFFTQLNKLILNKVPCRILLILREEFIGHLSEFESLCPSIFQYRFRVEKMGRKNVEEVIFNILEAPKYNSYFKGEDSQKLAESILSKLPDKRKEIELAHVQVFLGELWDRALTVKKSNQLPLLSVDLIHDDDNLEAVLESFLKKQMSELETNYGERVPLELLAAMISERFTKLQLSEGDITSDLEHKNIIGKKPISELLKELEQRRILRTINVGDETQYEISHDVLALVVGQNLTEEMKMREKAGDIYKVYGERLGLFSQDDIDYLRPFQRSLSYPPELQVRIDKSIAAIKQQQEQEQAITRKRLRLLYSLLSAALIALVIAMFFYTSSNRAEKKLIIRNDAFTLNTTISQEVIYENPTLALRLEEEIIKKYKNPYFEQIAENIYSEYCFYKIIQKNSSVIKDDAFPRELKDDSISHKFKGVTFSHDGKMILVALDSIACLMDLKGNIIRKFIGNTSQVFSIAFSPDDKMILTGCDDGTVRLWDLKGDTIATFIGHMRLVSSVAFSPDGKNVLTASLDITTRLWDLKGHELKKFEFGGDLHVFCAKFSPDGKTILTGVGNCKARLLDLEGNIIQEFSGHTSYVIYVAFSPDGKKIITVCYDGTARLWDLQGHVIQEFVGHSDKIYCVAFSPDGKKILTGSADETARLWNLEGNTIQILRGHTNIISSVAFSRGGDTVVTSSLDGTVRLWKLKAYSSCEFNGYSGKVTSIAISPDREKIVTGLEDSTAILWDLNGNIIKKFKGHMGIICAVAFSPDGKKILTGSLDRTARMWDLNGNTIAKFNGDSKSEYEGHKGRVSCVAFSPDGKTILTASYDGTARLWNLDGTAHMKPGDKDPVLSEMKFIADGTADQAAGKMIVAAFSPDGKKIFTATDNNGMRLWDLDGNTLTDFDKTTSYACSVAFSPGGDSILTGSFDGACQLWDSIGHAMPKFIGHSSRVQSVAFSPDGKTILTGSDDRTARLWDLKRNTYRVFKGHINDVISVAYSADGKKIITGSLDGTTLLWDIPMPLDEFLKSDMIEPLSSEQKGKYRITN